MIKKFFCAFVALFLNFLLVLGNAVTAYAAETLSIPSPSDNYRDIKFQEFRGLPRFGYPDTSGIVRPGDAYRTTQNRIHNNAQSEEVGLRLEKHNYSIGLLNRLDFMHKHADCFKDMQGYEVRTESCAGVIINHSAQMDFWKKYIETMAFALKPQAHSDQFCPGQAQCVITQIDGIYKSTDDGRNRTLDEFEKRDFVNSLMKEQYATFEQYRRNMAFPKEAYVVNVVSLGDYDFDQQKFTFAFDHIGTLISQNIIGGVMNNTLSSRGLAAQATYIPSLTFEEELKEKMGGGSRRVLIDLPMLPDKARQMVQGENRGRKYYAVARIKFLARPLDQYHPLKAMDGLSYHYSMNMIELFVDEALTQKVAEVPFVQSTVKEKGTDDSGTVNKYILAQNSRFLDSRALSLIRYKKKENILPADMDRIAYSISGEERGLWIEHKQRLDAANRPMGSAQTERQQRRLKDQKKMSMDRAKLSTFSWQEIDNLSAEQKKAFYNYMLGYGDVQKYVINWPNELASVPWGMNLVTVFKKGYFSDKKEDQYNPANETTREIIQQFLHAIADSQNPDHLTLVYGLDSVSYDQSSSTLVINQNTWPFKIAKNITFTDGGDKKYTSAAPQLVSPRAKARVVYRFKTSDRNLGHQEPDPQFRNCVQNQKRHSYDCVTSYPAFMPLSFGNTYMALDRKIAVENIPISPEKGMKLMNNGQYPGWRVVVELTNPEMDLIKYDYTHPQTKKDEKGEAQTLFANVKRVLILAPNDEIVWSKEGTSLVGAEKISSLQSPAAASYNFPDNLKPEAVLYDFMLAKYYPERLSQKMLEAMMSSRWAYESEKKSPLGGRFFNQKARTPSYDDVKRAAPDFKKWLMMTASKLPTEYTLNIPLYYAQNTFSGSSHCVEIVPSENSPGRAQAALMNSMQAVAQCKNKNMRQQYIFETCETLRSGLAKAEADLELSEKNNCKKGTDAAPAVSSGNNSNSGPCQYPENMDVSMLGLEMKKCILEVCGQPTNITGMAGYQACITEIQEQAKIMMQNMTIFGKAGQQAATPRHVNTCKAALLRVRDIKNNLNSFQCNTYGKRSSPQNCEGQATVKEPNAMKIAKLEFKNSSNCSPNKIFYRHSKSSAILLPDMRPYDGTNLDLEILFKNFEIPYAPPFAVAQTVPNVNAAIKLKITGVNQANMNAQRISVNSKVIKIDYLQP